MLKKVVSSLVIGLLLISVILGGTSCFGEKGTTKPTPAPTETKVIKITADDLVEEYRTNEIAADHKYKNDTLIIVGLITDISRDLSVNKVYVSVCEEVRCFFNKEEELLGLAKREEIIVKGKCLGKKEKEEGTSFPILLQDCSLIKEAEFQLIDWKVVPSGVVSDEGLRPEKVCLGITYKKFGYSLIFTLINPKGKEMPGGRIWWDDAEENEDEPYHIPLAEESYANPLPGEYKLVVKDVKGKVVVTQTFNFSGPHPEMEVIDEGSYWKPVLTRQNWWEEKHVTYLDYWINLRVSIKNSGDLPFCFCNIKVLSESAQDPQEWYDNKKIIAPGEKIAISIGTYYYMGEDSTWVDGLRFYSPGEKIVTLQFVDGANEIVYSLNTTITVPEKPPAK